MTYTLTETQGRGLQTRRIGQETRQLSGRRKGKVGALTVPSYDAVSVGSAVTF